MALGQVSGLAMACSHIIEAKISNTYLCGCLCKSTFS